MKYFRCNQAFTLVEGATHVEISANIRHAAFTLAEVLITLGVIGIVAAITIPNLMGAYRKSVAENKLKTTYSLLSQALEYVNAESDLAFIPADVFNKYETADGNGYSWELSRDVFENYFAPHFQIIKRYSKNESGGMRLCSYKNPASCEPGMLYYFVRLQNGVKLGLSQQAQGQSYNMMWYIIVSPDKKKYLGGKDVFGLFVMRDPMRNNYNMAMTSFVNKVPYSKMVENCNSSSYWPKGSYSGVPFWCASVIFENGMHIPKDYPIKF